MIQPLTVGIKYSEKFIVLPEYTAKTLQSGGADVLGTPALIAKMEKCAWQSVLPFMDEGCDTVGTFIEMKHLSASPIGIEVVCESELIAVNGRELTFHITAYDTVEKIAEATHKRVIIKCDLFLQKTNTKLTN